MATPEDRPQSTLPGVINPLITATLVADYEAVRNDLVQAEEIAADYQNQLASKTNDCAQLKIIMERANEDLAALQKAITDLRADRHRLANEVQRLYGVRDQYRQLAAERKKTDEETQALRRALKNAELKVSELWARLRPTVKVPEQASPTQSPTKSPPAQPSVEFKVVKKPDASEERQVIGVKFDEAEPDDVSIITESRPQRRR